MSTKLKGSLLMITSAIMFGSMPLFVKYFYLGGANAISVVFYRNFLPLPILFFLMWRTSSGNMGISKVEFKKFFVVGSIGAALTPILMYSSYNYIDSSMSTTLHYIHPVIVFLECFLFFRDKIDRIKIASLVMSTFGILMFYSPGSPANALGILLALASGVTFATYIVYLDKSGLSKLNPFKYGFYNSLVCSVLVLGYALATGTFAYRLTPLAWGLLIFFSITITVIAVVCFQLGVRMIGPQNTAILSTFEPLTSIFWGIVVFQDQFNERTILGTVLILSSVLLLTLFEGRVKKPQKAILTS